MRCVTGGDSAMQSGDEAITSSLNLQLLGSCVEQALLFALKLFVSEQPFFFQFSKFLKFGVKILIF